MRKNDRTGESNTAKNGMKMTIIAYRSWKDIDVQFEDGSIRKGVRYDHFMTGCISPIPKKRKKSIKEYEGKHITAHNKMKMEIIKVHSIENVDILFEDGTLIKGTRLSNVLKGHVRNKNIPNHNTTNYNILARKTERVGEQKVKNDGEILTIVRYRSHRDIDVQFKDGAIRKGVKYQDFKNGKIRHPKEQERRANLYKTRLGEISVARNGMTLTITAYRKSRDIDVQFEDGFIKEGIDYAAFTTGAVQNPHFPMHGKGTYKTFEPQYAYTTPDGSVYFYCECQKCGWKKNLTARELINLNHTCENIEGSET